MNKASSDYFVGFEVVTNNTNVDKQYFLTTRSSIAMHLNNNVKKLDIASWKF